MTTNLLSYPDVKNDFKNKNFIISDFPEDQELLVDLYSDETKKLKVKELEEIYNVSQKLILRKIDLCVVPPFALLYFLAYFNRSSFGFIQISGIFDDLKISTLQFYSSYAAFFAPYILFQFFANYLLKRVRPHFWISISVFLYGAITFASGFTRNYATYVILHFLHGVVQAGSETAIFYIIAHYYTRFESQRRFSGIYSVSCLAGIISNLIAFGVSTNLDGKNGWVTWRWAVIIYGVITMFTALVLFFILPDFPEGARFFNDDETLFLIKKLEIFGGKSGYTLTSTKHDILQSLIDPFIWLPALMAFGTSYATYVYAFHEPIIMDNFGYGGAKNISFGAYPWVVAFIWCNASGYASELLNKRSPVVLVNLILGIIGAIMIFAPQVPGGETVRYVGSFFLVAGAYATLPLLLCWSTLNVCGHVRKSWVTSLQISFGSIGGIISIFTFYKHETNVRIPFLVCFIFQVLTLALATAYGFLCVSANASKRTAAYKQKFEEQSEKSKIMLGDKQPGFDYLL